MTSALKVDVENEFDELLKEADLLSRSLGELEAQQNTREAMAWLQTAGLAAGVEKIYSGCERIMQMLAKRIDGEGVDKEEGWHGALLKRMANDFPGIRGPIISPDCYAALDVFRGFRHRVRNSYGGVLDGDIVRQRARKLAPALAMFRAEVLAFLDT